MRRLLLVITALFFSVSVNAGFPFEATLQDMAREADHILVGRVTGVEMIDAQGEQVRDRDARTGPGLTHTIRLLLTVDEVLVTNLPPVPRVLAVPLASHLHYSLGQIQDEHADDGEVRLILLKGKKFDGIKPGLFFRPLSEKAEVLKHYAESHR